MSKRKPPDGQSSESSDARDADSPDVSDASPVASESNRTPETGNADRPSRSGLVIHTNVSSLQARANVARADNSLAASLARLSTGLRVGQGAAAPAGSAGSPDAAGQGAASEGPPSVAWERPYAPSPQSGTRLDRRA